MHTVYYKHQHITTDASANYTQAVDEIKVKKKKNKVETEEEKYRDLKKKKGHREIRNLYLPIGCERFLNTAPIELYACIISM